MKLSSIPRVFRVLLACLACSRGVCLAQEPSKPGQARLKIECFGPSRAYALGLNSITLIACVRNVGDAPSAEGAVSGRLTCVSGLDYTEGDTLPKLPSLLPNAVATYRWRVTPSSNSGALVAAFALEYPGATPDVKIIGIQHLPAEPPEGVPAVGTAPVARVREDQGVLENGRIRARIESTAANLPGLWLSARSGPGWRRAGVSLPLAEVLSGEGGQEPWWEVFRAEDARAVNGLGEASLILTGGIGIRWRATVTLTLRADSSVLDFDIRLAPLRPLKISGLRLGSLYAGDGGFGGETTEELPFAVNGANAVAAVRSNEMTVGASWPVRPIFRDWQLQPLPTVDGADYQLFGAEMRTTGAPVELQPGALVDYHCRLYALVPTTSVRNAFNIIVPSQRTEAKPAPPAVRALASRAARLSTSKRALVLRREAARRALAGKRGKRGKRSARQSGGKKSRTRGREGRTDRAGRHKSGGAHKAKGSAQRGSSRKRAAGSHRSRPR